MVDMYCRTADVLDATMSYNEAYSMFEDCHTKDADFNANKLTALWKAVCKDSEVVVGPHPLNVETELTGACTINRPCAQQYVGKSQSCMFISGRLIPHAPVTVAEFCELLARVGLIKTKMYKKDKTVAERVRAPLAIACPHPTYDACGINRPFQSMHD